MNSKGFALILGAGGFIGGAMATKLNNLGFHVFGADLKNYEYGHPFNNFFKVDLAKYENMELVLEKSLEFCEQNDLQFKYIFQYAADMGGAGYIFTGLNDVHIMLNSVSININLISLATKELNYQLSSVKIFYSSSACIYPEYNQIDPMNPNCREDTAYPANPDSEYGWEKIFSERLFFAAERNFGLSVRVARFHNIYGPLGTFDGGREKAPAALCRKVALANDGEQIEIWGDGKQTRSFLFIEDCIEATLLFLNSEFTGPLNIGSTEMISINELFNKISYISKKTISKKNVPGPTGVRGRNSDNKLIEEKLGWSPRYGLDLGLLETYKWIEQQVAKKII